MEIVGLILIAGLVIYFLWEITTNIPEQKDHDDEDDEDKGEGFYVDEVIDN